jgi:hypothetical protein
MEDLTTIRAFSNPPAKVKNVLGLLSILLNKPASGMNWQAYKLMLRSP